MKKLLLSLIAMSLLIVPGFAIGADRRCPLIWDNVAGHNFILNIGDQKYDVEFSEAYAGPCPQGDVTIFDGIYVAPRLVCPYRTSGDNFVVLDLGEGNEVMLYWWQGKLVQIIVPPNAIVLEPSDD